MKNHAPPLGGGGGENKTHFLINKNIYVRMVQVWQYNIRYYKESKRGRKQYYKLTSPYFGDRDMCYNEMVAEARRCASSDTFKLAGYWIDSTLVESFELVNAVLPF